MITPMDDGGPAFPQHGWSSNPEVVKQMQDKQGMTLRDWFAGQALVGLLLDPSVTESASVASVLAEASYVVADKMLARRKGAK